MKILFLAMLLLLLAAACQAADEPAEQTVLVYLPGEGTPPLEPVEKAIPLGKDPALFVLDTLFTDERSVIPQGVEILYYSTQGETAEILLSENAIELSGFSRTLVRAGLVLSLTALEGISGVSISIEGHQEETIVLEAADFVLGGLVVSEAERLIAIYFPDASGERAVRDTRTLVVRETDTIERYLGIMLEAMIAGPRREGFQPALPEGTRLLSVSAEGGICSINFSSEFLDGLEDFNIPPELIFECLYRSATAQSGINDIRLLVEGIPLEGFNSSIIFHEFP